MKKSAYYFDSISKDFEAWINPFDLSERLKWFASQLDGFNLQDKLVLDVGCGLGHFSQLVLQRKGFPVCLDLAKNFLARIKQEIPNAIQANALDLPFKDGTFTYVISSECIEHTQDPQKAIKEMIRVLRPNGVIIISTPNHVWKWSVILAERLGIRRFKGIENWPTRRQLRDYFRDAGMDTLVDNGLYILPFQIKLFFPLINWFNKHGQFLRGLMINQLWVARKKQKY